MSNINANMRKSPSVQLRRRDFLSKRRDYRVDRDHKIVIDFLYQGGKLQAIYCISNLSRVKNYNCQCIDE
jgi:hypothetical protein